MSAASERRALRAEARDLRRELIPRLKAAIKEVRARRRAEIKRCAGSCTGRKARVRKASEAALRELRQRIAKVKEQARAACGVCRTSAKATELDQLDRYLGELSKAREDIQTLRRRAGALVSARGRAGGLRSAELRAESDEEVARNIGDDDLLLAAWKAWKSKIHASPHRSRTEAFLDYVHDHSADLASIQAQLERRYDDEAEQMLAGLRGRHGRDDRDLDAWRSELQRGAELLSEMTSGRDKRRSAPRAPAAAAAERPIGLGDIVQVLRGNFAGRIGYVVEVPSVGRDLGIASARDADYADWWIDRSNVVRREKR